MKSRWLRPLLLLVFVGGGFLFYRLTLRPDPARLEAWAESALKDIFGPDVTHGRVEADPLDGVRVYALAVRRPGSNETALSVDSVEIRHDVLAMTAGVLRLQKIVLDGPTISTHETESGDLELDFPFELPRESGKSAPPPTLVVRDGTFRLKAHAKSEKFRPGSELVLGRFHVRAIPDPERTVHVDGGFVPQGVGLAPTDEITFAGTANLEKGLIDLHVLWDRLRLTPEVRAAVAPGLLEKIEAQRLAEGPHRLDVHITRDPAVEAGRVRLLPHFQGTVRMDITGLPGAETIDARTKEQINELFGKIDLNIEIEGNHIDIRRLTTSLAGADVRAEGRIEDGGQVVDIDIHVEGLRLDDPALLKALGPVGTKITEEFGVHGRTDALISLRRERGGPFRWEAAVDLIDATLVYLGRTDPEKKTPSGNPLRYGFPYAIEHAFGRVYVHPDEVLFDGITGRHGPATIRLRGSSEKSRTGGETGFVRWGDGVGGDTKVALTIDAKNMPVDTDLEAAVEGSEFAGFLDTFRPTGSIDRIVLDILKRPHADKVAAVELDVDLSGARFRYAPFPLVLDDVKARVSLSRPEKPQDRGRRFDVSATGRAAGADVSVLAWIDADAHRGRVHVTAKGARIEGDLEDVVLSSAPGRGALGNVWRFLSPRGTADVTADLPASDDPGPEQFDMVLHDASIRVGGGKPDEGVSATQLSGEVRVYDGRATIRGLRGLLDGSPLAVDGEIDPGPKGRWDVTLDTKTIAISNGLLAAIAAASPCAPVFPKGVTILPGGHLDLRLHLRRDPQTIACDLQAGIVVENAELFAKVGDVDFTVRGGFSVDGDDVRMHDLTAEGQGLFISIPKGRLGPAGIEGKLSARLTDVVVTPDVLALLPEKLRPTFKDLTKDRLLQAKDIDLDVDERGAMTVSGALGLTARADAPAGGAPRGLVEFGPVHIDPTNVKDEREVTGRLLLRGLDLDVGTHVEEVQGALELKGVRLGDPPTGEATLHLETARVAGLFVRDAVVPLRVTHGVLSAPIDASFYGGRLTAAVSVHTKEPLAFEGHVHVEGVSLEALRADLAPSLEVSGVVSADITYESRTGSFRDLVAQGTLDVRDGDLGNLPPVATLPALLGSLVPASRKPKFHAAHVEFTIERETIHASCLRLFGPLFVLDGHGTVDFSGNLDVTLAPQFIKSFVLPGALEIPGIGDLLGLLREDPLYVVKIRGPMEKAKPVLVPFPFLTREKAMPDVPPIPFDATTTRRIPHSFR